MRQLNPEQQQAVEYISGPLLVLAGAGSGKTSVITEKIAYLIQKCHYKAHSILAVTFTNKAAKEMKSRVQSRLEGENTRGLRISTFHNLGLTLLRKHHALLGYKANFTLFDEQDAITLIHEIAYSAFQSTKQAAAEFKQQISLWKNALLSPSEVVLAGNDHLKQAHEVYIQYQKYLKAYNAVDFDDLIFIPVQLLKKHPEVKEYWQQRFHYVLIDEYQDTNESQYKLMQLLVSQRQQFTVVGDDDQSIYAWRGARPENLSLLQQDYPKLKVVKLEQNYRSSGRILHAANTLIDNNPHLFTKKLWSAHHYGEPIRVLVTKSEEDEAQRIASEIMTHKVNNNTHFKDYAVLIRGNHQSFLIERYFQLYKIPYAISGGSSFFAKAEIKDALAYFKLLVNDQDDCAFLRVINTPRREIGPSTLEKLGEYATSRHISLFNAIDEIGLTQVLKPIAIEKLKVFKQFIYDYQRKIKDIRHLATHLIHMMEAINYHTWLVDNTNSLAQAEKRYKNVLDLIGWICEKKENNNNTDDIADVDEARTAENAESLSNSENQSVEINFAETINRMLLLDIIDREQEQKEDEKVQILTVHASKGLEYPHVYVMGVEEGLLPHQQSIDDDFIEEERRLAYVAITRAKHTLTLTLTKMRKKFGETIPSKPSRFIDELPQDDLSWSGKSETTQAERKTLAKSNLSLLKDRFS
ncbi:MULTISPECIES: UvrD-helicase domain-containing protein [Cysteiniphilum]|uniref:UvrD-helicase domain-containing protein n=1 Tax=Cysteiniphilum TaxID=2056696 RepID=UPI00177A8273|nr:MULTISPECIES: UvrD-helicase domain-containing protein [Cysteiniphilum]